VNISPFAATLETALQLTGGVTVGNTISLQGSNSQGSGGVNFGGQLQSVSGTNTTSGSLLLSFDAVIGADAGSTLNVNGGIYNPTTTARALSVVGAGTININSALASATATPNQFSGISKYGPGTTNLTVAQTLASGLNIYGGTFALNGAGRISSGSSGIGVQLGSTLRVDDSGGAVANRLGGTPVILVGGTMEYIVNGTAASTETAGYCVFPVISTNFPNSAV
jgi:hypothetical protein